MPFQPLSYGQKPSGRFEKGDTKKKADAIQEELVTLEEEKVYREGTVAIRDLIAPSALRIEPNFVQLGDTFLRTIFVVTYPRYISIGWSAPILNLNVTMDVSMFFYPVPSPIILKQLKKKVGALGAQITSDREKGAARDPLRETALQDIESLRDDLTQG
ncbi:MAG TPA: conjugal transfer protein TraC, partial [Candidatus Kapabacteria bacterium]|nr:conjugal transfer protein TraC [Candidatus Kapabacteria bacterium]